MMNYLTACRLFKLIKRLARPAKDGLALSLMACLLFTSFPNWANLSYERFDFELSSEAQDAINSGVTLSINADYAVRTSYWLFSTTERERRHQFKLMRHTLSKRYVVKFDDDDRPHIFRSIGQACNFIANQSLTLLENYSSQQDVYSMRLALSRFDLPSPMRLNAFISKAWDLDTGWIEWQSAN